MSGGGDHVEDASVEVDAGEDDAGARSEHVLFIGAHQTEHWS